METKLSKFDIFTSINKNQIRVRFTIETSNQSKSMFTICALYKFVHLDHLEEFRVSILKAMDKIGICGTLLIAQEGINGTIAAPGGKDEKIKQMLDFLKQEMGFDSISCKFSQCIETPFKRSKVKLKKEIVTMGVEDIDPIKSAGTYVKPKNWNALISDPNVILIDTRNDYEVELGSFKNAQDPKTTSFREFPDYVAENLNPETHKKVAMFCTGGIRCEKSTAYLKKKGFEEVYHLEGGILKYLEDVDKKESLWEGECFVFDDRVSVDQELKPGNYDLCFGCRLPITKADTKHKHYEKGVSCHRCYDASSKSDKNRFRQRQQQIKLAKIRNEAHIGGAVNKQIELKRIEKKEKKKS